METGDDGGGGGGGGGSGSVISRVNLEQHLKHLAAGAVVDELGEDMKAGDKLALTDGSPLSPKPTQLTDLRAVMDLVTDSDEHFEDVDDLPSYKSGSDSDTETSNVCFVASLPAPTGPMPDLQEMRLRKLKLPRWLDALSFPRRSGQRQRSQRCCIQKCVFFI